MAKCMKHVTIQGFLGPHHGLNAVFVCLQSCSSKIVSCATVRRWSEAAPWASIFNQTTTLVENTCPGLSPTWELTTPVHKLHQVTSSYCSCVIYTSFPGENEKMRTCDLAVWKTDMLFTHKHTHALTHTGTLTHLQVSTAGDTDIRIMNYFTILYC